MALSADVIRSYDLGDINSFGVLATSQIYKGAAVGLSSGYARGLVAGDLFVGFALENVLGNATNGGKTVQVQSSGKLQLSVTSLAITDIDKTVYASADGTFTLTQGSNTPVGTVYRFISSGVGIVKFDAQGIGNASVVALTDNSGGASADGTIGAVTAPTALTDNGGGTADATVASQAAPTTITDNSGLSGTHDDTLAATAAITTITDSSGLSGTHDDTLAATAAITTLTDNSGDSGTHDDTIADGLTSTAFVADNGGGTADGTVEVITAAAAITDNSGGVDPGNNIIAAISDPAGSAGMVTLTNVATAAAAATQLDISAATGGESMAGPVQPSHPRNIKITVTDANASISAFTITVSGKAPDGTSITEQFLFAGGLIQTGSKIFASLTSVVLTSITGNGAGDLLDAAWGVKLGVPLPYGSTGLSIVKLSVDGTNEAATATDTTNNSFTATTAPNGAHDYEVWYEWTGPATTSITAAVAQLAAKQNTTSTAIGAIKNDVKECTAKIATLITDVTVQNQNDSDLGQKVIELVTRDQVHAQNVSDLGQKIIELVTRDQVHAQNVSDLGQKIIELVTLAGTAQNNLKELTTRQAENRTAIVALTDAVKELSTKVNEIINSL